MHRVHHGHSHSTHDHWHHKHSGADPTQVNPYESLANLEREAYVFGGGTIAGAMEAGRQRCARDPLGLVLEGASAVATGAALAFVAEASPAIALGIGTLTSANYLFNLIDPRRNSERNHSLSAVWDGTWGTHDPSKLNYYKQKAARQIGPGAFDFALCTASSTAGFCSGEIGIAWTPRYSSSSHIVAQTPSSMLHAAMRRIQFGGSPSSDSMLQFIDGNCHALERNRLGLSPQSTLRYESAVRTPPPGSPLGMMHYVHRTASLPHGF